jgi:hypothetical protein
MDAKDVGLKGVGGSWEQGESPSGSIKSRKFLE